MGSGLATPVRRSDRPSVAPAAGGCQRPASPARRTGAGSRAGFPDYPCSTGGTAKAIDHVALSARGFEEMRERCRRLSVPYRERTVPALTLCQLFFYDPNGVQLELNFNAVSEQPAPAIDASNFPPAGANWFDPAAYERWGEG